MALDKLAGTGGSVVVDTSEGRPSYLWIGKNGSHIKLSQSAYHLLQSVATGISFDMLAERLSQQQQSSVTPAEVEAAYRHVVERIEKIEELDRDPKRLPFGFWLRIPCLNADIVNRIAQWLSLAYTPLFAGCALAIVVIVAALMLSQGRALNLGKEVFWWGFLLFQISLVFHEFGHASACARYGVRPRDIGIAIYWIYPVFYSDVTTAWQLKRWQRVVVDLGGVFFQLIVGALFACGYFLFGWQPLKLAFLMVVHSCLFSLNPIFKFDGYWVVADALGIVNLGQQPRRIVGYLLDRMRKRETKPLPWPTPIIGALILYTLVCVGFWCYFIWHLMPVMWRQVYGYPLVMANLMGSLIDPQHRLLSEHFQAFFTATFIVLITVLMTLRLVKPIFRTMCASISKLFESRP